MQNWILRSQGIIPDKTETHRGIMQSSNQWPNRRSVLLLTISLGFFVLGPLISPNTANARSLKAAPGTAKQMERRGKAVRPALLKAYGKLPIRFEANRGQTSRDVNFLSRGQGYTLFLTNGEAVLSLQRASNHSNTEGQWLAGLLTDSLLPKASLFAPLFSGIAQSNSHTESERKSATAHSAATIESQHRATVRLKLIGANPHAKVAGLDQLPGKSNYFIGNDPQKWLTNVPNYAKVRYQDIYPGVSLVYYGNPRQAGQLEYDFVVAPGADPGSIKLSIKGADHLSLDAHGNLVIAIAGGQVLLCAPVVYQETPTQTSSAKGAVPRKHFLSGRYQLAANGEVSFNFGAYDASKPLVIDPVLSYSTYLGGTNIDIGTRVAVDSSGDAYVTGLTSSANFPNTSTLGQVPGFLSCGVYYLSKRIPCPDVFVTKLSPDGKTLVYSTFIGGSRTDVATGISVDGNGNVFLTGSTTSSDFPVTSGAFQTAISGQSDAFISKLNASGSALLYSTFLGGSRQDLATGIATDSTGNAYVTGVTFSTNFPTTAGSFQTTDPGGTTCVGLVSQCPSAFVAKLNSAGTALAYATYLGGSSYNGATSIAVDSTGSAYITGITNSTDFPTTAGVYQRTSSGASCGPSRAPHPCTQGFVTKLSPTGVALSYSTYLGGNGDTMGTAVAVDGFGNSYVAGFTNATDLPTTSQSYAGGACGSTTNSFNCPDVFVAKFNSGASALSYMTYLGGTSYDIATDLRLDASGDAYVVGSTDSLDFPVTRSAVQTNLGGGSCSVTLRTVQYTFDCPNAFLTVLNTAGSTLFSTFLGGAGGDITFGVAVDASGNAYLAGTTISADFPTANAEQPTLAGDSDAFVAKISGISTPQDFSLTASTTSQTVTAGGTASYDLTLTPEGGFNQAVSLSCSGVPAHSTCAVQPSTITLDGTNNASARLTVTTTGGAIVGPGDPGNFAPPSGSLPLAAWLALFSLLGIIGVVRMSRNDSRFNRLAPFAMLGLLVMLWAACGGGSSPALLPATVLRQVLTR